MPDKDPGARKPQVPTIQLRGRGERMTRASEVRDLTTSVRPDRPMQDHQADLDRVSAARLMCGAATTSSGPVSWDEIVPSKATLAANPQIAAFDSQAAIELVREAVKEGPKQGRTLSPSTIREEWCPQFQSAKNTEEYMKVVTGFGKATGRLDIVQNYYANWRQPGSMSALLLERPPTLMENRSIAGLSGQTLRHQSLRCK